MTLSPTTAELEHFLGTARWFGGKGRPFTVAAVRRVGELDTAGADGDLAGLMVDLVEVGYDDAAGGTELYQLPLAVRRSELEGQETALVSSCDGVHLYDAVRDHAAMELYATGFAGGDGGGMRFHRTGGPALTGERAAWLDVDQSNSSVAYGEAAILKVFRRVEHGPNPDVHVHELLTGDGCDHVAALHGWVDIPDPTGQEGEVIELAMLQQFLRTASDGWELARASVRNLYAEGDLHAHEVGGDFAAEAHRLGVALAETHAAMARLMPVAVLDPGELAARLSGRLEATARDLADLTPYVPGLRPVLEGVARTAGVPAQRIHGDLHLGQTLRTVRGWKLVDFEGEPARPLAARTLPDSVWRDVAGMLRSLDYAAAVVARELESVEPEIVEQRAYRAGEWSSRNREAFLDGYTGGRPLAPDEAALLSAYEADKAVYECLYEARNRPAWLTIPLRAVTRLAGEPTPG